MAGTSEPPAVRRRRTALARLGAERFDVLVIGGGSTGAGVALYATAAGLRVALVEREDFASGTSSRSTKLIHGGVRYLERAVTRADAAHFRMVVEGLRERAAFFRTAPYLSDRLQLLAPCYDRRSLWYYGAGLRLYDLLAGRDSLGPTRILPAAAAAALAAIRPEGLRGAVMYTDGQFDDARLNALLAVTAAERGAVVSNYAAVTALLRERGRIAGATVRDEIGGGELTVRADAVVNAAGAFADAVRALDAPAAGLLLRTSSGVHVVVRGGLCTPGTGVLLPRTEDGRVLFILPWHGRTLIGTTDRPEAPAVHPAVRPEDVAYLLAHANRHLALRLQPRDVLSAWSGLRPLVEQARGRGGTADLPRSHAVLESGSGLLTVVGGKWTTYRRIAVDAVDRLTRRRRQRSATDQSAAEVPIVGAAGYSPELVQAVGRREGLEAGMAEHLARRYGARMEHVAALVVRGGGARIAQGFPFVAADVEWAVREEMAVRVMDVIARRTPLAFLERAAAAGCVETVAALMAPHLAWDAARQRAEAAVARAELAGAL